MTPRPPCAEELWLPDRGPGPRRQLERIYAAALQAVDGRAAVRRALVTGDMAGPWWVIAVGKAAAAMTLGALDCLGSRCLGGLAIEKTLPPDLRPFVAHGVDCRIGGHPLPTGASLAAGEHLLAALARTPPGARLLFLISGGASSLVEVPVAGLGLAQLERLNRWLLASGLPIGPMNRVRTAVSRIKGGGLLAALPPTPRRVLAISDVPADDPGLIGSGLLVPASTAALAVALAGLDLPPWLRTWVELGLAQRAAAPRPGPPIELVATLGLAKSAAAAAARAAGLPAPAGAARAPAAAFKFRFAAAAAGRRDAGRRGP